MPRMGSEVCHFLTVFFSLVSACVHTHDCSCTLQYLKHYLFFGLHNPRASKCMEMYVTDSIIQGRFPFSSKSRMPVCVVHSRGRGPADVLGPRGQMLRFALTGRPLVNSHQGGPAGVAVQWKRPCDWKVVWKRNQAGSAPALTAAAGFSLRRKRNTATGLCRCGFEYLLRHREC